MITINSYLPSSVNVNSLFHALPMAIKSVLVKNHLAIYSCDTNLLRVRVTRVIRVSVIRGFKVIMVRLELLGLVKVRVT